VEDRFDVVVVGGRLAGLSLAFGLADKAHSVAVVEARPGVKPVKRGLSLSPNGLEVLDKLGLLQDIERVGCKVRLVKFLKNNGELLVAYNYGLLEHKQNYVLVLLPHELELLLRKRALDKGVKLYEGASFGDLLRENGRLKRVRATFAGSVRDFGADVIVGADGAMSKVRESARIKAEVKKYSHSYLVTVAGETENSSEEARHYLPKERCWAFFL
jgi:2-polyprenyl-6-methoxyphenol hydroxylase-like FAD-dependent oxidoreductase